MLSKITIDVDEDNSPIIKVQYAESEDVRDKLVKRFLESFRGEKDAELTFLHISSAKTPNTLAKIKPK